MKISVILCTYNRCESLTDALRSIADSAMPSFLDWEVVVVDNNSTDKTRDVIQGYCSRTASRFRYAFEPRRGLSNARNAGIREARGDVLAFVDDDVTVEPVWLHNLTAPLMNHQWAGSGGRTLPARPFTPPDWLPAAWGGILGGLFDAGDQPCELKRSPYGVNMAFRKEMFEKYGRFRTDLGVGPNNPRVNEDTEFGRRLLAAGERLFYEPSAVVYHPILESRLRKDYFLAWWFDYGRAEIREKGPRPPIWGIIPRHYFSIPAMIMLRLPTTAFRWLRTSEVRDRFRWQCCTWVIAGCIVETYRLARKARRPKVASQEAETGCDARM
jgi:glycosyltransferase involved in cell wall biosynthesis